MIGRGPTAHYVIHSKKISKEHMEIARRGHRFTVRDLGSRNGTFVNGERLTRAVTLKHGDLIHVSHHDFRFSYESMVGETSDETMVEATGEAESAVRASADLHRILHKRMIRAVFQPIVRLSDRSVVGYESLARNALPDVVYDVGDLFRIATERQMPDALSRVMRTVGLEQARALPENDSRLFLNVHPAEMAGAELLGSLEQIRDALQPGWKAVLEVHEAAVTDPAKMARLKATLDELEIELAYDDFGAGRSRLRELADVPPHFIKLDMSLIRGIDTSAARQEVVRALAGVMIDLGIRVLAEGIETQEEYDTCVELGCELGQGFLICRPASAEVVGSSA